MSMMIPVKRNFQVYSGGTWEVLFELKKKVGEALNLTAYTVKFVIEEPNAPNLELTEGAGLTVTKLTGLVLVVLTAAQSALVTPNQTRNWWISLEAAGAVSFPCSGILEYEVP